MKKRKFILTIACVLISIASYAWDYECAVNVAGTWTLFQWNDGGQGKWGVTGAYHVSTMSTNGTWGNSIWGYGGNASVIEGLCEPIYQ
ncbi:MAG: hypothetical protein OHK0057_15990 [Thermoflexibacter sp.]